MDCSISRGGCGVGYPELQDGSQFMHLYSLAHGGQPRGESTTMAKSRFSNLNITQLREHSLERVLSTQGQQANGVDEQ